MRYNLVIRNEGKGGASHAYGRCVAHAGGRRCDVCRFCGRCGASIVELHKEEKQDLTSTGKKLPTMAVMSALVFAGQMINYTIPAPARPAICAADCCSRRCSGRGRDSCP